MALKIRFGNAFSSGGADSLDRYHRVIASVAALLSAAAMSVRAVGYLLRLHHWKAV
jgi:hypothetical protein